MLQKRRDLGSIPDGLGTVETAIVKGSAVVRKIDANGNITYALPASQEEAADVYGFITLRIDDRNYTDKYWDTIPAGSMATVYTLVKNNEWATSQFVGELACGDKVAVGFEGENAGKLVKADADALFEVVGVSEAMAGYEDALVTVRVL